MAATNGPTKADKHFYGPFLKLGALGQDQKTWSLSVLVVSPSHTLKEAPTLTLDGTVATEGSVLDTYQNYSFVRFGFSVLLSAEEQKHNYSLNFEPQLPGLSTYTFVAPAQGKPLHWGFKSCDWFSGGVTEEERQTMGGHKPMWEDLWQTHTKKPLHFLVGGGDQLYCDPVFTDLEDLKTWSKFKGLKQMKKAFDTRMTEDMYSRVTAWYFNHYCKSFSLDVVADVLASIPQLMMWDDHDIFDGWGSYPKALHNCYIFQGLFAIATRFYLLFQQHTTSKLAHSHGFFGDKSYNFLTLLSPDCAILGMDMRAHRTVKRIIPDKAYHEIHQQLYALPASVKHLIVISTVPVVYPEVPFSETSLKVIGIWQKYSLIWACIKKMEGTGDFLKFDQPELLDDLLDHWGSGAHKKERKYMIRLFQQFAQHRAVRVSFISGDVHLASVGLLYGQPKAEDPKLDFRWMLNVTSSAIVNVPPPKGLVSAMTSTNHATQVDKHTREKMIRMFNGEKLMARRNWCDVVTHPPSSSQGEMVFQLRIEGSEKSESGVEPYEVVAPPLLTKPTTKGVPDFKPHSHLHLHSMTS